METNLRNSLYTKTIKSKLLLIYVYMKRSTLENTLYNSYLVVVIPMLTADPL